MATRIFAGHCEDCYDEHELRTYEVVIGSTKLTAELCRDCIEQRKGIKKRRDEQPPIGLLMPGNWTDVKPITFYRGAERLVAQIKRLTDSPHAGIVRLRLDRSKDRWLAAGVYGADSVRARSEARAFLQLFYFSNQPIRFDP